MQRTPSLPQGWKLWLAFAIAIYGLMLLCTRPYDYVDSFNYALHIVTHGSPNATGEFWDFGHPVWRPLGYVVWNLFRPLLSAAYPTDPALAAGVGLIALSMIGGLVSVVFLFLLAARATGKAWVAGAVAMGLAVSDAVVNYSNSGMAYMLGGCFQFVALYLLFRAVEQDRLIARNSVAAGLLMGVSVLFWFPYCLTIPGLFCFGLVWPGAGPRRLSVRIRFLIPAALAGGLLIAAGYAFDMSKAHVGSVADAKAWVEGSRYGIRVSRGYIRMVAGIPRSFVYVGQDAVAWKRMLSGEEGFSLSAILASGLWKVAMVFLVLAWLTIRLFRSHRQLFLALTVSAIPILLFAAFLFDPGPPIRYYPIFPLLFLAFAWVMANPRASAADRAIPVIFFAAMLLVNAATMWRFGGYGDLEDGVARLTTINPYVGPNDRILVPTYPDSINRFVYSRPFDPASRNRYHVVTVYENGTLQTATWQKNVARKALDTWSHDGHIWMTLRLLAPEPRPDWGWVKSEDAGNSWESISAFFRSLDLLPPFGGADGFAEIAPSEKNRARFEELTSAR